MAHVLKLGNVSSDPATSAAKAQQYLEKSVATGVTTYVEYRAAAEELRRLRTPGGPGAAVDFPSVPSVVRRERSQ